MPKIKTNSSAKKRFRISGGGGIKRANAYLNHILTKKTTKNKRQLRKSSMVDKVDAPAIKRLLPNG